MLNVGNDSSLISCLLCLVFRPQSSISSMMTVKVPLKICSDMTDRPAQSGAVLAVLIRTRFLSCRPLLRDSHHDDK